MGVFALAVQQDRHRPQADVVGARGLGMMPVLLDRQGEDPHSDCPTVTRLRELEGLLL